MLSESFASVTKLQLKNKMDNISINPDEAELLESVFRFGDKLVREVMTPRTDIIFVERAVV